MKQIDCKCGKCETVFTLQVDAYKARTVNTSCSYNDNQILCPTCRESVPSHLLEIVLGIAYAEKLNNWAIGTYFKE